MREDSAKQKKVSMDLLASMVDKLEGKQTGNGQDNSRILDEISNLKNEISYMRNNKEGSDNNIYGGLIESAGDFANRVQQLEEEIAQGTVSRENLLREY